MATISNTGTTTTNNVISRSTNPCRMLTSAREASFNVTSGCHPSSTTGLVASSGTRSAVMVDRATWFCSI